MHQGLRTTLERTGGEKSLNTSRGLFRCLATMLTSQVHPCTQEPLHPVHSSGRRALTDGIKNPGSDMFMKTLSGGALFVHALDTHVTAHSSQPQVGSRSLYDATSAADEAEHVRNVKRSRTRYRLPPYPPCVDAVGRTLT